MPGPRGRLSRALQVAIDTTDLQAALALAEAVRESAQVIELGTPLLLAEGLRIVPAFRERCPNALLLADTKIADAGYLEASHAFSQGADAITVLAVSDDATVSGCVRAASEAEGRVFADLMHVTDVPARAAELAALGVDVLCLHTAWDRREHGIEVLSDLRVRVVRRRVTQPLAVAGGVTLANCREVLEAGADILVVGGGITARSDPGSAAAAIRAVLEEQR
jgi:3-hexulose-6-phosphate synthase